MYGLCLNPVNKLILLCYYFKRPIFQFVINGKQFFHTERKYCGFSHISRFHIQQHHPKQCVSM
jgi:hypothetical protein